MLNAAAVACRTRIVCDVDAQALGRAGGRERRLDTSSATLSSPPPSLVRLKSTC